LPGPAPEAKAALRNRPLTAQEQYEKLKHFLPMTKEPDTPRPKPEELMVHTRLRVEWSGAWWKAKVKDVTEDRVKIGFETWSSNYDEWIPRDSTRLRLPAPDDVEVEANPAMQAGFPGRRSEFPAPEDVPVLSGRQRPFVPKPYNPEKEFQKRQLRLREKIANMQKSKLGSVDSSLESLKSLQATRFPFAAEEKPADIRAPPIAPAVTSFKPAAATPFTPAGVSAMPEEAAPSAAAARAETAPSPEPATPKVLQQASRIPEAPADAVKVATGPAEAAKAAAPADQAKKVEGAGPAKAAEPKEAATKAEAVTAAKAQAQPSSDAAIRWEEVLTDSNERYYHELSSGRTQWELPTQGWVELISDDGSRYYWEPEKDITQWTKP